MEKQYPCWKKLYAAVMIITTYICLAYAYRNTDKNGLAIEMLEKGIHVDKDGTNNTFLFVDQEKGRRDVGNACYNLGGIINKKETWRRRASITGARKSLATNTRE